MKTRRLFHPASALLSFLAFAGCSTTENRIQERQALFDAQPAETREKIRAGRIDVGFTPELVRLALGNPDRSYTRTSSAGDTEVWAYRDKGPALSFGFGVGGGSGGTSVGAGIGVGGGRRDEDKLRVIFDQGKVTAIERRAR